MDKEFELHKRVIFSHILVQHFFPINQPIFNVGLKFYEPANYSFTFCPLEFQNRAGNLSSLFSHGGIFSNSNRFRVDVHFSFHFVLTEIFRRNEARLRSCLKISINSV